MQHSCRLGTGEQGTGRGAITLSQNCKEFVLHLSFSVFFKNKNNLSTHYKHIRGNLASDSSKELKLKISIEIPKFKSKSITNRNFMKSKTHHKKSYGITAGCTVTASS